jgi:hypothetical protein
MVHPTIGHVLASRIIFKGNLMIDVGGNPDSPHLQGIVMADVGQQYDSHSYQPP